MAKLGDFRWELVAIDQVSPATAAARRSTDRLRESTGKLRGSFSSLASAAKSALPFLGAAGLGAAAYKLVGTFKDVITSTADAGDKFAKMSQRLGISVETLSTFDHVAKLSGLTIDTVAIGLRRFAQNALDMSRGIGEAKREFEDLGISVTDSQGKVREMEDLLLEVAERFSQMEDGTTKTAMAMRLFGRSGTEMIPMLNKGKAGLREMMEEAKELGLVFSEKDAKAAEEFNDSLTRLKGATTGLKRELGTELIPTLTNLAIKLTEATKALKDHRGEVKLAYDVWMSFLNPGRAATRLYEELTVSTTKVRGSIDELVAATAAKNQMDQSGLEILSEKLRLAKEAAATEEYWAKMRLTAAVKEAEATDEFIGLTGTKQAAYELFKELEKERAETEQWAHENRLQRYIEEQEALDEWLGNLNAFEASHGEIQQRMADQSTGFMETATGALQTVQGAMQSTFAALAAGSEAWKGALVGLLSTLVHFLISKGMKKRKEMVASSAEHTAKAAESAAEWNVVGAIMHAIAAALFGTAAGAWSSVGRGHRGIPLITRGGLPGFRSDEVPIIAQSGERLLSRREASIVGRGPIAEKSQAPISIVMYNTNGPINNINDIEDIGVILAESMASAMRY